MILKSKIPIYEQIIDYFIEMIDKEVLKHNDKLPSVRTLALELGVNPNTVSRAFLYLEEKGYVYSLNKKGFYVSEQKNNQKDNPLSELKQAIRKALYQRVCKEEIYRLVDQTIKEESYDTDKKPI